MDNSMEGVRSLKAYQLAELGETQVYRLVELFPATEKYLSVDQLKRSAASVANNIAESYHKRSIKEKVRILHDIAKGEAEETRQNLKRAKLKRLVPDEAVDRVVETYDELHRVLSGYIRFLQGKK